MESYGYKNDPYYLPCRLVEIDRTELMARQMQYILALDAQNGETSLEGPQSDVFEQQKEDEPLNIEINETDKMRVEFISDKARRIKEAQYYGTPVPQDTPRSAPLTVTELDTGGKIFDIIV